MWLRHGYLHQAKGKRKRLGSLAWVILSFVHYTGAVVEDLGTVIIGLFDYVVKGNYQDDSLLLLT